MQLKIQYMSTTKIALVTGGSRGLGKDMALSIARKGIDVIITYRSNEEMAQQTVAEIEAIGQKSGSIAFEYERVWFAG